MINKTFNSIISSLKLTVYRTKDGNLGLKIGRFSIHLEPSDAPALALAIFEAAGVAESSDAGVAANYLRLHISEQERATAEAKEQAELEAEALELFNAFATSFDRRKKTSSVDTLKENDVYNHWLAVARRAREMREEK